MISTLELKVLREKKSQQKVGKKTLCDSFQHNTTTGYIQRSLNAPINQGLSIRNNSMLYPRSIRDEMYMMSQFGVVVKVPG